MLPYKPTIEKLNSKLFAEKNVSVSVLRLDLLHPEVSGNKWFKLKYNLESAKNQNLDTILTFGGAFSNHIHATAAACKLLGLKSIGIIRGEEIAQTNPTLSSAMNNGMRLRFISRGEYKLKEEDSFIEKLKKEHGDFYLIPEGGNNALGEKGCKEILEGVTDFDHLFCACGTGTTFKGLSKKISSDQKLLGISVLKGEGEMNSNNDVLTEYHFGGYAKYTAELLDFKKQFEKEHNIHLDYVYTSKLFFAVHDLISKDKIPANSKVLIIHSGGLQGNKGYEIVNHFEYT